MFMFMFVSYFFFSINSTILSIIQNGLSILSAVRVTVGSWRESQQAPPPPGIFGNGLPVPSAWTSTSSLPGAPTAAALRRICFARPETPGLVALLPSASTNFGKWLTPGFLTESYSLSRHNGLVSQRLWKNHTNWGLDNHSPLPIWPWSNCYRGASWSSASPVHHSSSPDLFWSRNWVRTFEGWTLLGGKGRVPVGLKSRSEESTQVNCSFEGLKHITYF